MILKCILKVLNYHGVTLNFSNYQVNSINRVNRISSYLFIEIKYIYNESNRTLNQGHSRKLCYFNGNNDDNDKDRYNNKYNNDPR